MKDLFIFGETVRFGRIGIIKDEYLLNKKFKLNFLLNVFKIIFSFYTENAL